MEKHQERVSAQGPEEFCIRASVKKEKNVQLHKQITKMPGQRIFRSPNYLMSQERDDS